MIKLKAAVCAVTHAGNVLTENDDNFVLNGRTTATGELKKGSAYMHNVYEPFYLAVCDGMGGEAGSDIACRSIIEHAKDVTDAGDDFSGPLATCLRDANQKICDEISATGNRIGTTVAALYAIKGKIICVNVGNSRIYRFSNGSLDQITDDANSRNLGIFPDEAPLSPGVSVIDDSQDGDVLLICSDGLTDLVGDDDISAILGACENPQEAASRLVKTALRNGGSDNVSVIAVYLKTEQPAGTFAPLAQSVIGSTDADYSEEYQSNYGRNADRNAALAALSDTEGDDDDDDNGGAKKVLFMAGIILLAAALMVLVAFGVKSIIQSRNAAKEAATSTTMTQSVYEFTVTELTETETETELETETETETEESTTRSTTKRYYNTTQKSTNGGTKKTTAKTTAKSTTEKADDSINIDDNKDDTTAPTSQEPTSDNNQQPTDNQQPTENQQPTNNNNTSSTTRIVEIGGRKFWVGIEDGVEIHHPMD